MTPTDMARWIFVGVCVAVITVAWALGQDVTPGESIGRETESGTVLYAEQMDTAYAEPTPAPSEPTWRDSLALCGVRAVQVGAEIPMREPYEELFGACTKAVAPYGPWRAMVGVER